MTTNEFVKKALDNTQKVYLQHSNKNYLEIILQNAVENGWYPVDTTKTLLEELYASNWRETTPMVHSLRIFVTALPGNCPYSLLDELPENCPLFVMNPAYNGEIFLGAVAEAKSSKSVMVINENNGLAFVKSICPGMYPELVKPTKAWIPDGTRLSKAEAKAIGFCYVINLSPVMGAVYEEKWRKMK